VNGEIFVITVSEIVVSAYLGTTLIGAVLSFTIRQGPRRKGIRIATVVLTIPICLFGGCTLVFWEAEPPTLAQLKRDFPSKKSSLEKIVRMSDEDSNFWRIASYWGVRATDGPIEFQRVSCCDGKAGLTKARWDAYNTIFSRNGIQLGIQRDKDGDVFVMVDSVGLLNRGHVTGYVRCSRTVSQDSDRYYPCKLGQDTGKQDYNPDTHQEAYSFQKLSDGWYVYDEGPS